MESQEEPVIENLLKKLEIYKDLDDTSGIRCLVERYVKTRDFATRFFLLKQAFHRLNSLRTKFPLAEFTEKKPVIRQSNGGIKIGSIIIGGLPYGEFTMTKEDLNKNVLVTASVGHGKTSLIYSILSQLDSEGITYMLFDMKRDYRSLAFEKNTIYLDSSNLRINPLEPPAGVRDKEWAAHFADAFAQTFSLLIGSRDFLLDNLLRFYGLWKGNSRPSLADFLLYLEGLKIRSEYLNVVKGRLKALLSSTDVFSGSDGVRIEELDAKNVIFGMDGFGLAEQSFIVAMMLSYLFYMNMADISKRNRLYKVVCIDDAHTILDANREKDYAMGVPLLHQIISKMRELGVGFVFSDQQISSLLSSVIQNSNTKFVGRINLVEDLVKLFGKRVTPEIETEVMSLGAGEFIALSPNVYPSCRIRVNRIAIEKEINDTFLKRRNGSPKPQEKGETVAPPSPQDIISTAKTTVIGKLKSTGIEYHNDENGILVKKPKTAYIMFSAEPEDIARMLETPFDVLVDIVPDGTDKDGLIRRIAKARKVESSLDLSRVNVLRAEEFVSDLLV